MKLKLVAVAVAFSLVPVASFAADPPAPSADKAKAKQTKSDGKRDGEGRKKYLDDQSRKIDKEYEDKIDKTRDGQKGMANSGATHNKIKNLEKERDDRKQKLQDHYNKGPKAKNN